MTHRLLAALLLTCVLAMGASAQPAPTVVVVVRHAEKGTTPANDPPLTEAGVARAKALAAALADANVRAVLSTPLARTRETARPSAEARGLAVETVAGGTAADQAKAVSEWVKKHAGQTVLVVGHSNTVAPIIAALGGPKFADLCDAEYSHLYTLVIVANTTRLIRGSYGAPSPDRAAACANQMP